NASAWTSRRCQHPNSSRRALWAHSFLSAAATMTLSSMHKHSSGRDLVPAADLVVHGGKVATDYGVFDATVVIRAGRIAALEDANSRVPDATARIDARGKIVIPGCVDAHCHFNEPRPGESREGFESGTRSAAAGGVTTVLEHPVCV